MTDETLKKVIRAVADRAWEIASSGGAPSEVCLAIEALSDDPDTAAALIETIKRDYLGITLP